MIQNLKVDLIYYNTNTDFEMEFNMCGCCKMRLLTDKTDDQKNFIHMLARGVSRSKIIMAVGKLFGDAGLINTTAMALNAELSPADKDDFGISGGDEIKIITGSIPLVTSEGYFGGCIIEHGPQTMILLSENKNVRKDIMEGLIHPYITDISKIDSTVTEASTAPQPVEEPVAEEPIIEEPVIEEPVIEEPIIEPSVIEDEPQAEQTDVAEEFNFEAPITDSPADDSAENELTDNKKINITDFSDNETDLSDSMVLSVDYNPVNPKTLEKENDGMLDNEFGFISQNDSNSKINPKKMRKLNFVILAVMILLVIAVVVVITCALLMPHAHDVSPSNYIRHIFYTLIG